MSRPAPASTLSAPSIHPRSHQPPQRRPSGGRPVPTSSHSQPIHPLHVPPLAVASNMHPSASAPGSRSSRPQSSAPVQSAKHAGLGAMHSPDNRYLQQHRPPYPSQASQGAPRYPQPRSKGTGSDTAGSDHTSGSSEIGSLTESTRVNIIRQTGQMVEMSSPKEIVLDTPRVGYSPQVAVRDEIDIHLEHLFDKLQVPDTVRAKFSSVSPGVKSSIISSSYSSNPAILASLGLAGSAIVGRARPGTTPTEKPPLRKRLSQPVLRKQKSASSISSPGNSPQVGRTYRVDGESFTIVASPPLPGQGSIPMPGSPARSTHVYGQPSRGQSMDVGRPAPASVRTSHSGSASRPMSFALFGNDKAKANNVGLGIAANGEQPESFVSWLRAYKATDLRMDVDKMKKLRMVLRHEKTEWVARFLELGGYGLILARLQDLLDIEWREEQHDDQMLHELIRCVKALSTSEIGKDALCSSFPRPFDALSSLLFSEKKPGDLPVRQLIIELWTFVFELFPPSHRSASSASSSPITSAAPQAPFARQGLEGAGSRPTSIRFDTAQADQIAAMTREPPSSGGMADRRSGSDAIEAVRSFLIPKTEDKAAEQHAFITQAHRPKVFKAWVQELSDICRDYFWIMCHANNTLWAEEEVDERLVTRPVAPGGATGGVEFEAMNYVITHFRLLNTLCFHLSHRDRKAASELHGELMMSGMDRILVTMRKASTTFYPTLHLEIARYVTHLRRASPGAKLPHLFDKMVGPPPEEYRKRREMPFHHAQGSQSQSRSRAQHPQAPTQPQRRSQPPQPPQQRHSQYGGHS